MRKAFVIYEEDFDLSIETLPLCISLVKAWGLMKRCEQWEVKSPLSFLPILRLLIQPPLRPYRSLGYHGTKTPVATRPELHKSDFYCVVLLLISIHWRLYLIPSLWRAFSGQSIVKRMPGCVYACVCVYMHVHGREKRPIEKQCCLRLLWTSCMHFFQFEFPSVPIPVWWLWDGASARIIIIFNDESLIPYRAAIIPHFHVQMRRGVHFSPLFTCFFLNCDLI